MAGANMSGELKDARRSIPVGTMAAIGVSLLVYLALAAWLARSAETEELISNYTVMVDKAAWGPAILAGLLGATFSSALSSLVGAPRILQALGTHKILPQGKWLSTRTATGEPRNALFVTGAIVVGALMLRSLNAVAPLITMFFLITYGMINAVVLIEQTMQLVSFRPLFRVPRIVPLIGGLGCLLAMFIVNPVFGAIAIAVVLVIHAVLIKRHLKAPFGDVRSGLFVAVAEWAAKKMDELTASRERAWKANLLVPVQEPAQVAEMTELIEGIAYPRGFLKLVGLTGRTDTEALQSRLPGLSEHFQQGGIFSSWTVISAAAFGDNLRAGIQAFGGTFFRPTVLLLQVPTDPSRDGEVDDIVATAVANGIGVVLVGGDAAVETEGAAINVWFRDRGPKWDIEMDLGNQDLAVLVGYKLKRNQGAALRLVAEAGDRRQAAGDFLTKLADLARIPNAECVTVGQPPDAEGEVPDATLSQVREAAINIMPVGREPDLDALRHLCERDGGLWLFTHDSGEESALG
jgi:hypothetical protein